MTSSIANSMTRPACSKLVELIRSDMKPALGVTEPGAIAFAVAKARERVAGQVEKVELSLNSGMYKNAFTCGIPHSSEVGNAFAAALGAVGADASAGLESLAAINEADNQAARQLLEAGKVEVRLSGVTPDIFIEATVRGGDDACTVTIEHGHTSITSIRLNGEVVFLAESGEKTGSSASSAAEIHNYTLRDFLDYISEVPAEELAFMAEAHRMNLELFRAGLASPRTTFAPLLYRENGGREISDNPLATAQLLCNGAIEARVLGLDKPAMSITGSGAHGIICVLPLYAETLARALTAGQTELGEADAFTDERLLRATALSYLITMYIKEYSGKLSAFCGCAIAAGTGMACALAWLRGADYGQISGVIANMASSITGMICDGGNQGCAMKGVIAVDAAFRSVDLALAGVCVDKAHGINGQTPELTMRYMGLIASPGMTQTEKTILDILEDKSRRAG